MASKRARAVVEEKEEEKSITAPPTKKARLSTQTPDDLVDTCVIFYYDLVDTSVYLFHPSSTPHGQMLKKVLDDAGDSLFSDTHEDIVKVSSATVCYALCLVEDKERPTGSKFDIVPAEIRALSMAEFGTWTAVPDGHSCTFSGPVKFYSVPFDW